MVVVVVAAVVVAAVVVAAVAASGKPSAALRREPIEMLSGEGGVANSLAVDEGKEKEEEGGRLALMRRLDEVALSLLASWMKRILEWSIPVATRTSRSSS